jgi:hypothetical protein
MNVWISLSTILAALSKMNQLPLIVSRRKLSESSEFLRSTFLESTPASLGEYLAESGKGGTL